MTPTDLRDHPVSRRCALLGVGGVGAAAVLAACSSGSGSGSGGAGTTAAAPGSSTASTPDAASSAATPGTPAGSAAPGGDAIASLASIPVGGTASAQVDGETVLLSQPSAGKVEGFSAVCPHQGGQVKPDGAKFRCSLHFSEFAIDGAVTKGPAQKDLSPFAVAVSGTDVVKA